MDPIAETIRKIVRTELEAFKFELQESLSTPPKPKKHQNIDEASVYLNMAKQTIYGRVCAGTIPYHKNGKLFFITEELDQFINGTWTPSIKK